MTQTNDTLAKAKEILRLLGGSGRLKAMIGARDFVGGVDSLGFTFPNRQRSKPNGIRVIDLGDGEYNIEFWRLSMKGGNLLLATSGALPGFMLKDKIEEETGFRLSL